MADPVRPTCMVLEIDYTNRIDTAELRTKWAPRGGLPYSHQLDIIDLCDEVDILRGELASVEFQLRRRELLDALKIAIEKARTMAGGHSHG